jgi:hypothetical protein
MRLWSTFGAVCAIGAAYVVIPFLLKIQVEPPEPKRKFLTEQAAIEQFQSHRDAYQTLAEQWLISGNHYLAWVGKSNHREMYFWNDYDISPSQQEWNVTHWDGREFIHQPAKTFDGTAKISGTSGEEVMRWHHRLELLAADQIRRVSAIKDGVRFNYVEIEYFPVLHPYGFRFAPRDDSNAQRELQVWAKRTLRGRRMDALGHGWFYYEGHWPSDSLPFSLDLGSTFAPSSALARTYPPLLSRSDPPSL